MRFQSTATPTMLGLILLLLCRSLGFGQTGAPPNISGTIASRAVFDGDNANFALVAMGPDGASVVWRIQVGPRVYTPTIVPTTVSGIFIASGIVGPFTLADNGLTVTISGTNAWGTSTMTGTLLVNGRPPTFTGAGSVQPAGGSVSIAGQLVLTGKAVGSAPISYQWKLSGGGIAGATTSSYTIQSAQLGDAGSYTLVATSPYGTATSAAAVVTVAVLPVNFTQQPQSRAVTLGGSATFHAVVSGSPPMFYQWRKDGFNVEGATNAALTISNVRASDVGEYFVVVTNPAGTVNSNVVRLDLAATTPPPPPPPTIAFTLQPQGATVTAGGVATFQVATSGTTPISYQWRRDNVPIAGATNAMLSIADVQLAHAGSYTVVATNAAGAITSNAAVLVVNVPLVAPTITLAPRSQEPLLGATIELTAEASGSTPMSFQWTKNGSPILGATKSTLSLASIRHPDAGGYAVVVSNGAGAVTSASASVTVKNPGRLANLSILTSLAAPGDTFSLGVVLGGRGVVGTSPVLVRAAGPSLAPFGVTDALSDPRIEIYSGATRGGENDDWGGSAIIAAAAAQVGAFPFSDSASKDAAFLTSALGIGESTMKVSGAPTSTGMVLAELYDASPRASLATDTPRLVNLSVLTAIGSRLTAGFVIDGTTDVSVLIRAIGPSLAEFGVSGFTADPRIELLGGDGGALASSNDWGATPALADTFGRVGAFPLTVSSKDAALVAKLAPGSYTVEVTAAAPDGGTVLVEIYELP